MYLFASKSASNGVLQCTSQWNNIRSLLTNSAFHFIYCAAWAVYSWAMAIDSGWVEKKVTAISGFIVPVPMFQPTIQFLFCLHT